MSQEGTNNINSFTEEELKEKEKEILNLMKKTIIEFKNSWYRKSKGGTSFYNLRATVKDYIEFKKHTINLRFLNDGKTGIVFVWGKRRKADDGSWTPSNLKISFMLDSTELFIKLESYTLYPIENCSLIKDIFYRMDVKNNEDYNLLLKAFENLLVSYI